MYCTSKPPLPHWSHILHARTMLPFLYLSLSFIFLNLHATSASKGVAVEYMYPPVSISNYLYEDTEGLFLKSRNGDFEALIYNPGTQESRYYLSVLHAPSKTQIWTANRNTPMPDQASIVKLTTDGLLVQFSNATVVWSTPPLKAPISALHLLQTGNLVLLDATNNSLWESFDYPSDTLVSGQQLPVGSYLSSPVSSESDLRQGNYRLDVTSADALLNWSNNTYWRLSNDINSVKDQDVPVAYMTTNDSGLYLIESKGNAVFQLKLSTAPFRIVQLGADGRLKITSYPTTNSTSPLDNVFMAPSSSCDLPLACGSLGLCSLNLNSSSCICPSLFVSSAQSSGCMPGSDIPLATNTSCDESKVSYMFVGTGLSYFANKYRDPIDSGRNISSCRDLCSINCSCSGYLFDNSSLSCFLFQHPIGSLANANSSESTNSMTYVKTQGSNSHHKSSSEKKIVAVLAPSIAAIFLVIVGLASIMWRYNKQKMMMSEMRLTMANDKLHGAPKRQRSDSDYLFSEDGDDIDEILIPGLPTRFTFEQLEEITMNFLTKIGSGGFGSVYKGQLPDNSEVAVKMIEGAGVRGRKEFCTEIAVIGNIHHVNLVRLRGYCAQGPHRLLVYEYMNLGSLDRPLFRPTGKTLDWSERMNIAIGAARGIAYLHSGCQPKILHCDIKPENILLDDAGQVKIADFGLAKLLTPEQTGLFTTMRGTRGYLAPEWLANTLISDRTDVYSFGMVLLELVRGRKNRSEHMNDGESKWSVTTGGSYTGHEYFPLVSLQMHEKRCYKDLADPRLEGKVDANEIEIVVKTALCCLHEEPALRPSMTSVVAILEGTIQVWEPRVESLGFLRLYGRGVLGGSSNGGTFDVNDEVMMNKVIAGSHMTSNTTNGWPSFMSMPQLSGPR